MIYVIFRQVYILMDLRLYCIREEAEARKRKAEEEAHKAKILNQKVPIGKPTNAAIMKAEKVRNDRLREQEEERRVRARMRKKEISEKEASAALRVIISEVRNLFVTDFLFCSFYKSFLSLFLGL